ncbi:MAG: DEAD/DEAH box helicase family protein [Candidatus Bathyarchaeia archaeon]|jgi:superfamily II DNA or RNA helicase
MTLQDLILKNAYDSDTDNVLTDFYIPALANSILYDRLTGFFSSTTLAAAAKGIVGLMKNGGSIRLITGAVFQEQDIKAIKEAINTPEKIIEQFMLKEIDNLEEGFIKDHVKALGWLVAKGKLNIKIAFVLDDQGFPTDVKSSSRSGIFHQKVGILEDKEGNKLSFSGSDNETINGWQQNIEEFKVFRNWVEAEKEYFESDLLKFQKFWAGTARRTKIIGLPKAVQEELIKIAPSTFEELDLDKWIRKNKPVSIELRDYQKKAVDCWVENGHRGIFEMATGTGKTFTALACLNTTFSTEKKLIVIISSPFIHLSEQWIREIERFGLTSEITLCDSDQANWKNGLVDNILDVENGVVDRLIILTTHNTFSSEDFIDIIEKSKKRAPDQRFFLIIDEVHGIGAPIRQKGLIEEYDFRLGLSATPKRWFDTIGTDKLFAYFGDVVYSFSLENAIKAGFLTPYIYKPYFTTLTNEELQQYELETRKLVKTYYHSKDDNEKNDIFTLLCIKRQKIIRNANNKFSIFKDILTEIKEVKHCLVYCSPQQIRDVQKILNSVGIVQHKFTQEEGTKSENRFKGLSERDVLIERFSEGTYQALVSMKCLDEGVDIPPARIAIMLDNSGNPREYIQRRGRVLRKFAGKEKATIYDIIVEPVLKAQVPEQLKDIERKIIKKELQRYREFSQSAENAEENLEKMQNIEAKYGLW